MRTLLFDVLVAPGVLADSPPELFAYAPSYRGGANVNDRSRDIDRVAVPEEIEVFAPGSANFETPAVPNYRRILERIAMPLQVDLGELRVHRLQVQYPPFGYQFVSAFRLPDAP